LDAAGFSRQRERYRVAGESARVTEHDARHLVVRVGEQVPDGVVAELVAVERECCPFFALDWNSEQRRLAVSVSAAEHEPALEAIVSALGVGGVNRPR
jgi:hypothetical protein